MAAEDEQWEEGYSKFVTLLCNAITIQLLERCFNTMGFYPQGTGGSQVLREHVLMLSWLILFQVSLSKQTFS